MTPDSGIGHVLLYYSTVFNININSMILLLLILLLLHVPHYCKFNTTHIVAINYSSAGVKTVVRVRMPASYSPYCCCCERL